MVKIKINRKKSTKERKKRNRKADHRKRARLTISFASKPSKMMTKKMVNTFYSASF